jgi:purine-nucleoside phosphorylase
MVSDSLDVFSGEAAPIGVVSGSGINLRPLLDEVCGERSFADAAGISGSGIVGHDGLFVFGRCGGVPVILQAGRIHVYEGHAPAQVASTINTLYDFGVRKLILTNAVGGLDPSLSPGDLVAARRIETWRYRNHPFPACMEPELIVPGCDASGTYIWMHGPCYETRAEIQALQRMGGLTVGMSLPLELARCQQLGVAAGVVSCVTNDCTRHDEALTHAQVVDTANQASRRLSDLLRRFISGADQYRQFQQ